MKQRFCGFLLGLSSFLAAAAALGADFYVSPSGAGVRPFGDWLSAATNIQDAIDVALEGDTVWVTNGIYAAGGKVMAGDLTNRIALDKALAVRSVNGPMVTIIRGVGAVNGPAAVRCAWLTNRAVLKGFTLEQGATRTVVDPSHSLTAGGGVWCASTDVLVANCLLRSNASRDPGSGAYQGKLQGCVLSANLNAAAASSVLNSCTVVTNAGGGVVGQCYVTNSIVYYNSPLDFGSGTVSPSYSCCVVPGPGNIRTPPQLMPDGIHLTNNSPCIGAGTNLVSGEDIDGQPWGNPPSIGADQWQASPFVLGAPTLQLLKDPVGFALSVLVLGQSPYVFYWSRDGVPIDDDGHYSGAHTARLVAGAVLPLDAGYYQVVVSNAFGTATSAVSPLLVHYVDQSSPAPAPPFFSWATAATNIQDAIDAAQPGEIVLVTNGVYASGGRAAGGGTLTNRITLDKAVLVQSVNGPASTIIQGQWDLSTTNGPLAVRCAWLTNGAILSGFTIRNGGTREYAAPVTADRSGGGVYATTNATVANSQILANSAALSGGGVYSAFLHDCSIVGNIQTGPGIPNTHGGTGGGATACIIRNCRISGNVSDLDGGGVSQSTVTNSWISGNKCTGNGSGANRSTLTHCTVAKNVGTGLGSGAAVYYSTLLNCIVCTNSANYLEANYALCTMSYCSTTPLPAGPGNIAAPPQLLPDDLHLSETSPCIAAGTNNLATWTDIDGQSWGSPPSMGCDQWAPAALLILKPAAEVGGTPPRLSLTTSPPAGQAPFSYSWLKDGTLLEDDALHYASSHTTNLLVSHCGPLDAGGYQAIASNAFGISTGAVMQVVMHCVDPAASAAAVPYSNWLTAATIIQDAIDAAGDGEFVLVTNGIYEFGGRVIAGDLTNRVAIVRPITVISMNGPEATTIRGSLDPITTNGPLATRCAWLGAGARLEGFTLTGGATRSSGDVYSLQSGGGVASADALVVNCIITANFANDRGGGSYGGRLVRCRLTGNTAARYGGGEYWSILHGCSLSGNSAATGGGGYYGTMYNCTVTGNSASTSGGGLEQVDAMNCIIYYNSVAGAFDAPSANWHANQQSHCCTTPAPPRGVGNFTSPPELTDEVHLATTSPCRGAGINRPDSMVFGSNWKALATDLDGEAWTNPPSIGCDEVWEAAIGGPLSVDLLAGPSTIVLGRIASFGATVKGRASRVSWDFGDGVAITNQSFLSVNHSWTNPGVYSVTFAAFNLDHPEGVSTNITISVVPLLVPEVTLAAAGSGTLTLRFEGQAGVSYVLQQATNLAPPVVWGSLGSYVGAGGPLEYVEPSTTNDMRFYRVTILP